LGTYKKTEQQNTPGNKIRCFSHFQSPVLLRLLIGFPSLCRKITRSAGAVAQKSKNYLTSRSLVQVKIQKSLSIYPENRSSREIRTQHARQFYGPLVSSTAPRPARFQTLLYPSGTTRAYLGLSNKDAWHKFTCCSKHAVQSRTMQLGPLASIRGHATALTKIVPKLVPFLCEKGGTEWPKRKKVSEPHIFLVLPFGFAS
jgi:hypothetical protein